MREWNVVPDNIVPLRMLIRDLVAEIDRLRAEAASAASEVEP